MRVGDRESQLVYVRRPTVFLVLLDAFTQKDISLFVPRTQREPGILYFSRPDH